MYVATFPAVTVSVSQVSVYGLCVLVAPSDAVTRRALCSISGHCHNPFEVWARLFLERFLPNL